MTNRFLILFFLLIANFSIFGQDDIINKLKIQGNKKTRTSFINKIIDTKAGQLLDTLTLDKDITRLIRLPGVTHVSYQINTLNNNKCDVIINIEENFSIIPGLNIWTTNDREVAYKIGLYEFNFFGRNITFGGFYQNNGFNSYAINFKAPNLFSKKWGISLNHQNWKSKEPLYFEQGAATYEYNNISYEALALFELNFKNSFQFGINFFSEKYKYISGLKPDEIPLEFDIDKTLIKYVYTYNDLKYFYQYLEGFKSELYAQYVISNNDFQNDFLIFWNDFFYYKRINKKGNWANRLRIGLASNEVGPFAPFALDNNINIRGVGFLVDRGTGSIVLNTEYRHTLIEKKWFVLQSNIFIDAGSWRNPGGEFNDFINNDNVRISTGGGLRFIHKRIYNAIFRIDYGYGITNKNSNGFVFGVGQYF